MLELVQPAPGLHEKFIDCTRDWGPGLHEDGFGLAEGDNLESPQWFAGYVHAITRLSHPRGTPCPNERHATWGWILEDGRLQGSIVLRHLYDDDVGHIAYGVRPSARRRGLASWATRSMLQEARLALGLDRVLIPCLAGNLASARTIESVGGELEAIVENGEGLRVRRYWMPTTSP
ncbi:MAG TPA: GNAT family N-acetyltransferase [Nocardioides sp.]|uniref:GNAT family N-acetyltransferase n=1 Tax=uncultured Nocardioides sp. TaxID=198441 RepID=UPI000EECBE8F|nr:GNAT family N-acetyltransferase [uncultured Nocardioides sp.]HCB05875.1 GNAT family N-acetyltransferase [Nocardioides sp.]HRD61016.1 GNAT family N-acetyltransferase [Nocardioides sp.]HRI94923.1 GNAT family N-acetyltransferase [Nocardioides sp.]HRK44973.1 GNAT family N-acetyltransferase [Nocardioides sp.]